MSPSKPASPTTPHALRTVADVRDHLNDNSPAYLQDGMNLYCVVKFWPSGNFVDIENCWSGGVQERVPIKELLGLVPVSRPNVRRESLSSSATSG